MNQKVKITEYTMNQLGIDPSPSNMKKYTKLWWQSIRQKPKGGLWLTEQGFHALQLADIKHYQIKFEQPLEHLENKFIIWLDNTMDCPFFLNEKEIFVFGERTAIQVVLFSGDLRMWHKAHTKSRDKKTLDNT